MPAIQELLKSAVIVYLIGLQLVIILLLVKPQIAQTINYKFGIRPKPKYYDFALSKHLMNEHRVPQGAIIFIGDSITENLDVSVISPKAVNLGISKDTTVGVLKRLPLYDSLTRCSAILLAIGINDLTIRKEPVDIVMTHYQMIVAQLPAHIPLIFSGVLPLGNQVTNYQTFNLKILALNEEIKKLAATNPSYYFIDAGSFLMNKDGYLRSELSKDGVHLNNAGYTLWGTELKKFLMN